ncbi:MAG: peptidase [Elainellaceae cyanobacterium]
MGPLASLKVTAGVPETEAIASLIEQNRLPPPRPHSIPPALAQVCEAIASSGSDSIPPKSYFDAVETLPVGYLIWSRFPVSVYVEPLTNVHESIRLRWDQAIAAALQDWGQYISLEEIPNPETAAIRIHPVQPPIRRNPDGTFRAQAGETHYQFYLQHAGDTQVLMQRFDVSVKPGQAARQLEATLRHELGHAFGIWGHSSNPEDALYYSQVAVPPAVSAGDIMTLCEIYRQPTSIGWPL